MLTRPQRLAVILGAIGQALLCVSFFIAAAVWFSDPTDATLPGPAGQPEARSAYTGEGITRRQAAQRPLAVMVASDPITRPQSGLGAADVVVEMEAAPGITRLMAIFQSEYPQEVGSIRSARNDYIDLARGFDAVFVHWGGEKRALDRLASDDTDELDQFANGDIFYRKPSIPAPHNGFIDEQGLQTGLERYDYDRKPVFTAWKFAEAAPLASRPRRGELNLNYGNPDFSVTWTYDGATNQYARSQGSVPHRDGLSGSQLTASNVVVVRAEYHVYQAQGAYLEINVQDGGPCIWYQNGQETECRWSKGDQDAPLVLTDLQGNPISLVPGVTWIQVMLPTAAVEWTAEPFMAQ